MKDGRVLASGTAEEVLTAEGLTETYGVPVRVVPVDGQPVVLLDNNG
jgi:ABC-type cobalamin transport system ATPase subunit